HPAAPVRVPHGRRRAVGAKPGLNSYSLSALDVAAAQVPCGLGRADTLARTRPCSLLGRLKLKAPVFDVAVSATFFVPCLSVIRRTTVHPRPRDATRPVSLVGRLRRVIVVRNVAAFFAVAGGFGGDEPGPAPGARSLPRPPPFDGGSGADALVGFAVQCRAPLLQPG